MINQTNTEFVAEFFNLLEERSSYKGKGPRPLYQLGYLQSVLTNLAMLYPGVKDYLQEEKGLLTRLIQEDSQDKVA